MATSADRLISKAKAAGIPKILIDSALRDGDLEALLEAHQSVEDENVSLGFLGNYSGEPTRCAICGLPAGRQGCKNCPQ